MKITTTRPIRVGGTAYAKGDTLEVDDRTAALLVGERSAVLADGAEAPKKKRRGRPRKETTEAAPPETPEGE